MRARTLSSGRFLTQADVDSGALVTVLGPDAVTELNGGRNAVGQTVTTDGTSFTVVGVLDAIGTTSTSTSSTEDDQALVPQTTAASRLSTSANRSTVSSIYLPDLVRQMKGYRTCRRDAPFTVRVRLTSLFRSGPSVRSCRCCSKAGRRPNR